MLTSRDPSRNDNVQCHDVYRVSRSAIPARELIKQDVFSCRATVRNTILWEHADMPVIRYDYHGKLSVLCRTGRPDITVLVDWA